MNKKKLIGVVLLFIAISVSLFALNPIVGGENIYQLASPDTLSNGNSVTGGALPYSTAVNIAIQNGFHKICTDYLTWCKPVSNIKIKNTNIIPFGPFLALGAIIILLTQFNIEILLNALTM